MQHWNRLPRYYALKDSTLHEHHCEPSLLTFFYLTLRASCLFWPLVWTPGKKTGSCQATPTKVHISLGLYTYSHFFLLFILSYASSSSCIENLVIQSNPQAPKTTASLGMSPVASLRSYPCPTLLAKTIREIQMTSPHDTKENINDNCI